MIAQIINVKAFLLIVFLPSFWHYTFIKKSDFYKSLFYIKYFKVKSTPTAITNILKKIYQAEKEQIHSFPLRYFLFSLVKLKLILIYNVIKNVCKP